MPCLLTYLTLALILIAGGCSTHPPPDAEDPPGTVSGLGTITYLDLEGGFFGLIADEGAKYDLLNLDEVFQQDGLRVRFRVRLRPDVATIRMWGRPAEVVAIARLDNE